MEDRSSSSSEQRGTCDGHAQNTREREAVSYLKRKEIHDLVDSLLGELLLRRPDDPYEHLIRLLDRRILTRDGLVDSPPPFCSRDIIRRARQANLTTTSESTIKDKRGTFRVGKNRSL
ncbi:uncharacterized protein LOC112464251 [Temnothorax curvispinosus]|uniref:Uncharacterized protein LOC112464251 n=1 Tax=Temnothorax curvispinosus TaxID=300111 RepID=A0A6J1QW66_9HYME|nr:uncharacterized protein LOC112464251 [Temnothorax curvispinosus]